MGLNNPIFHDELDTNYIITAITSGIDFDSWRIFLVIIHKEPLGSFRILEYYIRY